MLKMKTPLHCYQVNSHETIVISHLPVIAEIIIALYEWKQSSLIPTDKYCEEKAFPHIFEIATYRDVKLNRVKYFYSASFELCTILCVKLALYCLFCQFHNK